MLEISKWLSVLRPGYPDVLKHIGLLCPTITNKYYLLAGLDTLSMGMHMPGCFITIGFLRPHNKTHPTLMFVFDLGTTTRAEGGILLIPIDDSGPLEKIVMGGRVFDVKHFKTYVPWMPDKKSAGGERPKRNCAKKHKSLVMAAWEAAVKDDTIMQKLIAAASSISWEVEKIVNVRLAKEGVKILLKYFGWRPKCGL
jgi:hypothetical protein